MVSLKEAIKPVKPISMDKDQGRVFGQSMKLYGKKKHRKAAESFENLSRLYDSKKRESEASLHAMLSNSLMMYALRFREESSQIKKFLIGAKSELDLALEKEPYWAEYLESRDKINIFVHQTFGCESTFDGKVWTTSCYKISLALGLPGISPGMTVRLECSICGKDPVLCDHIPRRIYDGRLCLNVAKDIRINHTAIVEEPMQLTTYVQPRPLTEKMLRRFLPSRIASDVIAGRRPLTCKDLIEAIRRHGLRGIEWEATS